MIKRLISLFFILPFISCGLPLLSVEPRTGKIINEYGEEIVIHGVNVVRKLRPWIPIREAWDHTLSLNEKDIRYLKNWGFNAVRLGVMWPGYSVSKNETNMNYLLEIKEIVDELGANGIYTLLDMHQDLLSEYFCGEGMPDHLIDDVLLKDLYPFPLGIPLDGKKPTKEYCRSWGLFAKNYLTLTVNLAFEQLYNKNSKINKELHKFWTAVANIFKDNTNVLGYEFINEPITGNLYKNPLSFVNPFCHAGHETLEPLYHSLADTIRKIDQDHIIVFESSVNGLFTSGFDRAPGGKANASKQIYSYHVYCPLVDWSGCPTSTVFCEIFDSVMFFLKSLEKKYFGCAALLTEFGALSTVGTCIDETHRLLSKAESYGDGWMYWQYKQYDDPTTANMDGTQGFFDVTSGKPHTEKINALTRPYARRIAGRLKRVRFDYTDVKHKFEIEYDISPEFTNNTISEIYVNLQYYGGKEPKFVATEGIAKTIIKIKHEIEGKLYSRYIIDHGKLKGKKTTIKIQMEAAT